MVVEMVMGCGQMTLILIVAEHLNGSNWFITEDNTNLYIRCVSKNTSAVYLLNNSVKSSRFDVQTKKTTFKFADMQLLYFFLDKIRMFLHITSHIYH